MSKLPPDPRFFRKNVGITKLKLHRYFFLKVLENLSNYGSIARQGLTQFTALLLTLKALY